jgi:hypothetical protein
MRKQKGFVKEKFRFFKILLKDLKAKAQKGPKANPA